MIKHCSKKSAPKSVGFKTIELFSLFVLCEFLFISALPKSMDSFLLLFYAAPLVDFQMEELCKTNDLSCVVFMWTMPISSIMPWLCRSLQAGGKIGCCESQPVLWSNDPVLIFNSLFTCMYLIDDRRSRADMFKILEILEIAKQFFLKPNH